MDGTEKDELKFRERKEKNNESKNDGKPETKATVAAFCWVRAVWRDVKSIQPIIVIDERFWRLSGHYRPTTVYNHGSNENERNSETKKMFARKFLSFGGSILAVSSFISSLVGFQFQLQRICLFFGGGGGGGGDDDASNGGQRAVVWRAKRNNILIKLTPQKECGQRIQRQIHAQIHSK